MNLRPQVSIIIPNFNRENLIIETLDSVLQQTFANWECIIIDDRSTDNSENVINNYIKKDNRFRFYKRNANSRKGANTCRNLGIQISKGEYILFLDSDDILNKNCLKRRVEVIEEYNTDFVIFDTSVYNFNKKNVEKKSINKDPIFEMNDSYLLLFLRYEIPWTIMSVLWKKKVFYEYSFDENLLRLQDVDFHLRVLFEEKFKFKRVFEIDNYYRVNNQKFVIEEFVTIILKSFLIFMKKHSSQINSREIYTLSFRRFIIIFYDKFIYNYYNSNKEIVIEIEKIINYHKLLTKKQQVYIKLKKNIIVYKLDLKKGLGCYRLKSIITKKINKSCDLVT
jgi:glycosyltransferase involved in cell wall biosynthesis